MGYSPWGREESNTTEQLSLHRPERGSGEVLRAHDEKGSLSKRGLGRGSVAGPRSCELGLGHVHTRRGRKSIHRMEGTRGRGPAQCTLGAGSAVVEYEGSMQD